MAIVCSMQKSRQGHMMPDAQHEVANPLPMLASMCMGWGLVALIASGFRATFAEQLSESTH